MIRNWRSKGALKQCAAISHKALARAEDALADAENQVTEFLDEIQVAAEDTPQDGPTLQQARAVLRDRGLGLRRDIQKELGDLRTALLGKRRRADRFTVALFGRTKAGKSTIREAITGGDGSTISKGGQRTTREVREYVWKGLSVLDTPGFGAYEGNEDRQSAFSAVDESDVIVFLLTSDSSQTEVADEMAAVSRLRKNVVFALNVKCALTKASQERIDFSRDPRAFLEFAKVQHRSRIESLAKEHANWMPGEIRLVALHAQAAHRAQLPECRNESNWLREASNLHELLHLLEDELHERGPQRRIQTIIGGTERALTFMTNRLTAVSEDFRQETEILEEKHLELSRSLADFVERFPNRCRDAVSEHFASVSRGLGSFVADNLRKQDFKDRWCCRLTELKTEEWGRKFTTEISEEVSAKVAEYWRQLRHDTEFFHQQNVEGAEYADPTDRQKIVRRVGIVIGLVAVAASVVAYFASPPGWITGAIAAAGTLTTFLSSLMPKGGKDWNRKVEEARQKLDAEIATLSRKLEESIRDGFSKKIEQGLVTQFHHDVKGMCESIYDLADAAARLATGLNSCRHELLSHYSEHFSDSANSQSVVS